MGQPWLEPPWLAYDVDIFGDEPGRLRPVSSIQHTIDNGLNFDAMVLLPHKWDHTKGYEGEGPLRIRCYLGSLSIDSLLDTGSDYDAIDKDLSQIQKQMGNQAFVETRSQTGLKHSTLDLASSSVRKKKAMR